MGYAGLRLRMFIRRIISVHPTLQKSQPNLLIRSRRTPHASRFSDYYDHVHNRVPSPPLANLAEKDFCTSRHDDEIMWLSINWSGLFARQLVVGDGVSEGIHCGHAHVKPNYLDN